MMLALALLFGVAATAAWLAHSWWWPYTYCRACRGRRGKGVGSRASARFYNRCRTCRTCGGGGTVRLGARLVSKATGRPIRGGKEER